MQIESDLATIKAMHEYNQRNCTAEWNYFNLNSLTNIEYVECNS